MNISRFIKSAAFWLTILLLAAFTSCARGEKEAHASPLPTAEVTAEPTAEPTEEVTPAPTADPIEKLITEKLASMTTEEKIGQLLMFGFGGGGTPDEEFYELISQYPVGNMIFYGMNIDKNDGGGFESVRKQIAEIDSRCPAPVPRLYSADVEGGTVSRFDWKPKLPTAYAMGRGSAEEARALFESVGQKLRETGINLDLAPVMDVSPDPLKTFLGTRIFSSDPEKAGEMGRAVTAGLHAGGCLAAAKHFPGHGGTADDTHEHMPVINKTADELWAYDLLPFETVINAGVDCVMTAHISYPALDPDETATTSYTVITEILRGRLGFDGVVISDEMTMGGVQDRYSPSEAAVKFINAGGDIVLCGADYEVQRQIIAALYGAISSGEISRERLDQSVYRILYLKYTGGIWTP